MNFDVYAQACLPQTHTIMGLRLKPLSLGHYILMKRFGCNYASDEETDITMSDLITSVLICSMTYTDAIKFFDMDPIKFWSVENIKSLGVAYYMSNKLGPTGYYIRQWGNTLSKRIRRDKQFLLLDQFRKFQTYLIEGNKMPQIMRKDNNNIEPSYCHWSVMLKSFLLTKYNEQEALNLPLSQAKMELCKYAEEQDQITFEDPDTEWIRINGIPKI